MPLKQHESGSGNGSAVADVHLSMEHMQEERQQQKNTSDFKQQDQQPSWMAITQGFNCVNVRGTRCVKISFSLTFIPFDHNGNSRKTSIISRYSSSSLCKYCLTCGICTKVLKFLTSILRLSCYCVCTSLAYVLMFFWCKVCKRLVRLLYLYRTVALQRLRSV